MKPPQINSGNVQDTWTPHKAAKDLSHCTAPTSSVTLHLILATWHVHTVPQAMEGKEAAAKMGRKSWGERRRVEVGVRKVRVGKMGRAENRQRQGFIYTEHL